MGSGVLVGRTPAPSSGTVIGVGDSENATATWPASDPAALGFSTIESAQVLLGLRWPMQFPDTVKSAGVAVIAVMSSATEPRLVSSRVCAALGTPTVW
jgi:hypothetical protein